MSKKETILGILRAVGVYERISKKVPSDERLVEMFENDFDGLIQLAAQG